MHVCSTTAEVPLRAAFEEASAHVSVVPVRRPWRDWRAVREVSAQLSAWRPRVLNTFDLKGLMIATIVRSSLPAPVALVHHLVDLQHGTTPLERFVYWRLLSMGDAVICDAAVIKRDVIGNRRLRPSVRVIPNGVDADAYAPDVAERRAQRKALGYDDASFVIGTVANFRPEKNYPFLIDTFAELQRRVPRLRLLAVGNGPDHDAMRGQVASRGLSSVVQLTGQVPDVRPYLRAMDLFVLCSLQDAFSNAVLQAMATALPVVCSRTGEFETILADGQAGLLFAPGDREGFLGAVSRVLDDASLRQALSAGARNRVIRDFALTTMVERYAAFFRELASNQVAAGAPND